MTPIGERTSTIIANTAAAYSSGDVIGIPVAVDVSNKKDSGQSVLLQVLNVITPLNKKLKIAVFAGQPTTCGGDNGVFQPTAADLLKLVDVIDIDTFKSYTAGYFGVAKQLALSVCTGINRKFYVIAIAGEDQTFADANAVKVVSSYYID